MANMPGATEESRHVSPRAHSQAGRSHHHNGDGIAGITRGAHTNFVLAQVDFKNFTEQLIEDIGRRLL